MAFMKSSTGMFVPHGAVEEWHARSETFLRALVDIRARLVAKCFALGRTQGGIPLRMGGALHLCALNLVLVFRRDGAAGSEPVESETSTVLIPSGLRIDFSNPSSQGAIDAETAGIVLEDTQCRVLVPEQSLCTAHGAGTELEADVHLPAEIHAWFTAERCGDPRGPFIRIRGDLRLPFGLRARFLTRGRDGGHTAASRTLQTELIPPDRWIPFLEREVTGGIGPEPSIWARLTDEQRVRLCPPQCLGRCVAMDSLTLRSPSAMGRRARSTRFGLVPQ